MRSARTATEKDAISDAIHEASVNAGYPEDDHFQRFLSLEEADLQGLHRQQRGLRQRLTHLDRR
jgi:hypothetical protein